MKIWMALQDARVEQWLRTAVGDQIKWCEIEEAEVALVTRLSDARKAVSSGLPLWYVGGPEDAHGTARTKTAKEIGAVRILTWKSGSKLSALSLLSWVFEGLASSIPDVNISSTAFRILVRSSRQSGGSFVAWNLWHVLCRHGINADLVTLSSSTPLTVWQPKIPIFEGEKRGEGEVWVIDASDSSEEIESDICLIVTDLDPAKSIPSVQDSVPCFRVVNRVPHGASLEPLPHFVVQDFGRYAYEAMHQGKTVAELHDAVDNEIWKLGEALLHLDLSFHGQIVLTNSGPPMIAERTVQAINQNTSTSNSQTKLDHQSTEGGFDLDG